MRPRCSALRDQDLRTRLPVGGRAREKGGVGAGAEASGGGETREATTAGTRSAHRQARSNAEALTRSGRRCRETEQADERVTQFENDGDAVEERKAETREGARGRDRGERRRWRGGREAAAEEDEREQEARKEAHEPPLLYSAAAVLLLLMSSCLASSSASSSSPSPAHNGQEPRPQPERHLRRPGRQVGTTQPTDQQPARVRRVEARLLDQLGSPQLHVVRAAAATCACCNDAHDDDEEQEQQQEQEQEQERVSVHVCFDHA